MSYDLEKAAEHVVHDYASLVQAGNDTQRYLPFPCNHYAERTFLVYCRSFADFFDGTRFKTDMYAGDFVRGGIPPAAPALWGTWGFHVNKYLMHLTEERVGNTTQWTGEANKPLLEGFQDTWKKFCDILKPEVKPAFDRWIEIKQRDFPGLSFR